MFRASASILVAWPTRSAMQGNWDLEWNFCLLGRKSTNLVVHGMICSKVGMNVRTLAAIIMKRHSALKSLLKQ